MLLNHPARHAVLALLAALLLPALPCRAEIREIKTLAEIIPSITPETLLVFDLDNTLIVPEGELGSDHWYYFLLRKYREIDHLDATAADDRAMEVWNRVQTNVVIRAVEPGTAALIRQLQDRGIPTVGLTARTPDIADITLSQLRGAGIELGRHTIYKCDFDWWCRDFVKYQAGILFVGVHSTKGEALTQFLNGLGIRPKRILFVDDRPAQVSNVDQAMRAAGIECLAFRYGYLDERVARFNADTQNIRAYLGELQPKQTAQQTEATSR